MCVCFKTGVEIAGLGRIGGEKWGRRGEGAGRVRSACGAGPGRGWRGRVTLFSGYGGANGRVWARRSAAGVCVGASEGQQTRTREQLIMAFCARISVASPTSKTLPQAHGPPDAHHQAFHRVLHPTPRARHRRVPGADAARGGALRAGDAAPVPARRHRRVRRAGPPRARLRARRGGRESARVRGGKPHGRRHGRGVPRADSGLHLDHPRPEPP